jgi:predicted AlkP superfamily pyrophosphatase or phosphodiesterase
MTAWRPPATSFCRSIQSVVALVSAAALLSAGCGAAGSSPTAVPTPVAVVPTPPPPPKLAILSIDGLRADALAKAQAPEIRKLMARGVYTLRARTILPPMTLPGHVSMLTGLDPKVHRILWDDYRPEKGTLTVPTVFAIAHAAGLRTVAVVGKDKLRTLAAPGAIDSFVVASRGDEDVANQAIVEAGVGFDLMFVHFPDVDLTGHRVSWMSAEYFAAVESVDAAVGRLVAALPPHTTVILTADHGGKDKTHGVDIPEDLTIPWVIAGPRVPARGEVALSVKQVDTAATALSVFGLKLPDGCTAQVVHEAFTTP